MKIRLFRGEIMGLLGVWQGTYVTARSATEYIDAPNIISDANKIKGHLDEIDYLVKSVESSGSELTREVLLIDDKDMSGNVEYTASFIKDTKTSQVGALNQIIQNATTLYNEKQEEFNRQAQAEDNRIRAEMERQSRKKGK
jgi:hypothetical protein